MNAAGMRPYRSQERRYRIAMIAACPFPHPRGTPIRALRMAEALANRGHEVHVGTYHLGDEPFSAPFHIHRIPRVPTYRNADPGPTYQKLFLLDPLLRRTIDRLLRDHAIDVIHAHHYEGLLIAQSIPSARRPPVVYDAHTMLESELPYYGLALTGWMKRSIGRKLDRRLPGRAAHVISVTELLRDRLVEIGAVPPERVTVVHNAVEDSFFGVAPAARPAGTRTVVFAGNHAAYQGIELLLDAFGRVASRRSDVRLMLVTGSPLGEYEGLVRQLGIADRIDLVTADLAELPAYLRAADVAVNPRVECDGIPQKLLNYMACGCPVVSFAGSAAHLQHGRTGWVVPGADTAAMAEGILRLLDDRQLARRLGEAASEQVRTEYSWDSSATLAEQVYARVLAEAPCAVEPSGGHAPVRHEIMR